MADGINYYREVQQTKSLKFSKCTEDWTRFLNNVFDALNRKHCAEGLRMGNNEVPIEFFFYILVCLVILK